MDKQLKSSEYIEKERKEYSLYIISDRAMPSVSDGLKPVHRRILWTARGKGKIKTATLAGATMPIHPHGEPSNAINTLAAPYGNNIPFIEGIGAFGTLTNPTGYGASRYTSVKISEFTEDVIFKDIDIIPMTKNYDETIDEPVHFLPLVPLVLLNPIDGIAIGFATKILPRSLEDIIEEQIKFLSRKKYKVEDKPITFHPTNSKSINKIDNTWFFKGNCKIVGTTTVVVTEIPYGTTYEKYITELIKLHENDDRILDFIDSTSDKIEIKIKFSRGILENLSEDDLYNLLNLNNKINENINVLNFDGESVWTTDFPSIVEKFTEWRLQWYVKRYERLVELTTVEVEKYKDILLAIRKNVGGLVKKISTRKDLCIELGNMGIIHVDYIASLPIYRFTEEEKKKVEEKIKEAEKQIKEYLTLLKSEDKRKEVYISELKQILSKYKNK